MNNNLYLSSFADLQSRFCKVRNLLQVAETGLAQNCLAAGFPNLIRDILSAPFAPAGNVVDDNVGTPLCEEDGNAGSDTSALIVNAFEITFEYVRETLYSLTSRHR